MTERVETLISKEAVEARVQELADRIMEDYGGKEIYMVCVLKGGIFFMVDLARKIKGDVLFDFMVVSSYGSGTESSGHIKIKKDLDGNIEGKDVLIVEDISIRETRSASFVNSCWQEIPQALKYVLFWTSPAEERLKFPLTMSDLKYPTPLL